MIFVDKSLSRVGTYAEALKQQFKTEMSVETKPTNVEMDKRQQKNRSKSTSSTLYKDKLSPQEEIRYHQTAIVTNDQRIQDTVYQMHKTDKVNCAQTSEKEMNMDKTKSNERRDQGTNHDEKTLEGIIDSAIEKKNSELKEQNQCLIDTLEMKINQKIDKTLEKRLREVSILVANTVTDRIVRAMNKKLETPKKIDEQSEENPVPVITQSTPPKQQGTMLSSDPVQCSAINKYIDPVTSTKKMLDALPTIEDRKPSPHNPPHDTKLGLTDELT